MKLKFEIDKIDKDIDQLVYKLYGLTEEEIKIVEQNIWPKANTLANLTGFAKKFASNAVLPFTAICNCSLNTIFFVS